MRRIVILVLIALYLLFVLATLYAFLMGGFSITKSIFMVLSVVTIIALTGIGGSNSRFWAYFLCGLLCLFGVAALGFSVWQFAVNSPIGSTILWAGPILLFVAAATYWVLRTGRQQSPEDPAELEAQ